MYAAHRQFKSKGPLTLRSNREIRLMRKAGLVVWKAHEEAAKLVQPGVTTRELDAAIERVFECFDAIPLFKGVPGEVPFPAATCVSVNEQVVHGIPGDRVLTEGDIVSLDTGCKVNGWCGDAARTHNVGQVRPRVRKLVDVTQGALDLAIALLEKKKYWSEVAAEIEDFVRSANFSVVENFVGHGIGRDMHEDPQIPNFTSKELLDNDVLLRPGLVLAIEPMVNMGKKDVECLADHWTQVTKDRQPSAHIEHTVALTANGSKILTAAPEEDAEFEFLENHLKQRAGPK